MKEQSKPSISGGAAALAAMAGVNIGGGGGGLDIASMFKNLIEDFSFNTYVIKKYHLVKRLSPEGMHQNMIYALNGEQMAMDIKNFFKSKEDEKEPKSEDELIFEIFKKLKTIISTSTDKESGAITLSATLEDRFLAKELVNIYLKEMSDYIKVLDMKEIAEQEAYYNNELDQASSIELKQNLADLLSALMKKKVLSQAGEYYMVKQLTKADVAYVKDKSKPKRALIIIVAFITSIILGIFMIFFREFLNKKDEDEIIEEVEVKKEVIKDSSRESDISF
jgi:capsular polysaccharide biosynthesis protein